MMETLPEMRELLEAHQPSLLLADLSRLPDGDTGKREFLLECRTAHSDVQLMVIGKPECLMVAIMPRNFPIRFWCL